MSVVPRYWGSWKGFVLKAIAVDGARSWRDIQSSTGLSAEDLNQALSELFSLNILSKSGDSYWIEDYDLYREYKDYWEENYSSPYLDKSVRERNEQFRLFKEKLKRISNYLESYRKRAKNTVIGGVLSWTLRNGVDLNPVSEHFYLVGDFLDRISKDIISYSNKQVAVVNPYVDKCSLSDKLKDACASNQEVLLITRSPESEKEAYGKESKMKYHQALRIWCQDILQ